MSTSFRKWVPKWLQLIAALVILIPTMLINGAYTGSSIDISNYLGVLSEDITMAYYATSAGMAIAYPLILKIRPAITTKTLLIGDLIAQICLSLACAASTSIGFITICSFFIGFLKAFALLEIMPILMPIFSPENKRSKFYSIFYPITMGLGQISLALTSRLAYIYQWQYMYYFMVALLLVALLFVLICFRYARRPSGLFFKEIDWISLAFISTFFLSFIYTLTYGKIKDWFSSPLIIFGSILTFFSLILFVRRQLTSQNPYVDLSILQNRNSRIGYLFMFVLMFFVSSSSLISVYQNSILKLDSIHSNQLYLWMLPGFIIGSIISWYWFSNHLRMRRVVSLGLFCFTASLALLYFQIHPYGLYSHLYLPMILRGIGMMILFISFGVYVIEGLSQNKFIHNAFFLIGTRSALAPALCASLFSNWVYTSQQKNIMILSETLNLDNPLTASRYSLALKSALSQGMSMQDAQKMAVTNIYNAVQLQATALSLKTILGYCLILCIILTLASALFPFYKTGGIKEAKTSTDMV